MNVLTNLSLKKHIQALTLNGSCEKSIITIGERFISRNTNKLQILVLYLRNNFYISHYNIVVIKFITNPKDAREMLLWNATARKSS